MALRCAVLAMAVLSGDVAVEVTDAGSLRTHKIKKPTSFAEVHSHLTMLVNTLGDLKGDMAAAKDEIDKVADMEKANSEELVELKSDAKTAAKEQLKTSIQENHFNTGFNQAVSALNNMNSEMVADSTAVNSNSANLNGVHDSFQGKKSEINHYEVDLGSATANVRNRRELFTLQIDNMKAGTAEIEDWANHATPVLNTQTKAIVNLHAWITHLEGQINTVQDMVHATQVACDTFDPTHADFGQDLEDIEIAQSEKPVEVAVSNVSPTEVKEDAAIMQDDMKEQNTIDVDQLNEVTAETETAETTPMFTNPDAK